VVGSGVSNVDKCGRLSQPSWLLGALYDSLYTYLLTYLLRLLLKRFSVLFRVLCDGRNKNNFCRLKTESALLFHFSFVQSFRVFYQKAVERGATVVREPWEETDEDGTVRLATIRSYGDTTHTLIDRTRYSGWFLPGFQRRWTKDPVLQFLSVSKLHVDSVLFPEQLLSIYRVAQKSKPLPNL